ncbi:MAG: PEP-CTERM sorting domain-containing protein [Sedimentisphaerales bacterium]|nr:PEP-CTERM sorting domain-containing protein [Sedimentisphaerales bacterium]
MKHASAVFAGWWVPRVLLLFALVSFFSTPAFCRTSGDVALLIQQTPSRGGTVTPGVGVHYFLRGSSVVLSANPMPGYEFVHWLGDVVDPVSGRTIAQLDGPKIVIAVFAKLGEKQTYGGGGSSGIGGGETIGGGAIDVIPGGMPAILRPPRVEKHPNPRPVPEPSTVLLVSAGIVVLRRKRLSAGRLR